MRSQQPDLPAALDNLLGGIDPPVARVLDRALSGADVTAEEAETLLGTSGRELTAVAAAADHLRRETIGDIVTYVVNRNINFTNVCIKGCGFCADRKSTRLNSSHEWISYAVFCLKK